MSVRRHHRRARLRCSCFRELSHGAQAEIEADLVVLRAVKTLVLRFRTDAEAPENIDELDEDKANHEGISGSDARGQSLNGKLVAPAREPIRAQLAHFLELVRRVAESVIH